MAALPRAPSIDSSFAPGARLGAVPAVDGPGIRYGAALEAKRSEIAAAFAAFTAKFDALDMAARELGAPSPATVTSCTLFNYCLIAQPFACSS